MKGRIALILLGIVLFSAVVSAQSGYAVVSGLVRDSSGAVIPGASISARNINTNISISTVSNTEGYYTIANLIPGTYTITAHFQGFRNLERTGIVLRVGDNVSIELAMEVGAAAEQVTVTAEAPLLRTQDAQSGQVIDNRRIQELPQYNRNPLAFALLTANVNGTGEQSSRTSDFRINGGRGAQAEYYIDGVPVTSGYQHDVASSVPSMEAVGEFNVVTNGLSAEYGRLSGGAIVLVTRGGTNQYHGSVYEYFRNDKLNANDWNSNRYGQRIGVFHDNVFGASLGGPFVIPKIYDGHNKSFFFFNYEGTRHVAGSNATTAGVPTALERQGDFTKSLIDNGKPVQVFDPLQGQTVGGDVIRQPFPGNRIPESRFNALSKVFLEYYPLPNNAPLPGSSHDSNYLGASKSPSSGDRWTGRFDQNWSSNHITHFSLTRDDNKSSTDRWLSALQPSSVSWATSHTVALTHTWMASPTTMLEFRGGVVRISSNSGSQVGTSTKGWPIQDLVYNLLGTSEGRAPSISTGDTITTLGGGGANNYFETNYNGSISVQRLAGKHTMKFGYEHRRYYANVFSAYGSNVGTFTMSTLRSATSQSYNSPPPTGSGYASWLLGLTTTGSGSQYAGAASLLPYHGAFYSDTFRASSRLTVTYGVRWEIEPPRTERYDRQFFWDQSYVWPWKPYDGWSWSGVLKQAGVNEATPPPLWMTKGIRGRAALIGTKEYPGRTSNKLLPYHFSPRIGLAYEFMPRTVLRATYGINWMTVTGSRFLNTANRNIGYGAAARYNTPGEGRTYPLTFDTPMPNGAGYVPASRDITFLNMRTMGTWFDVPSYDFQPGYEHAVGLGFQREVGSRANSWVFEVNYNSSLARGLPFHLGFGEHILPHAYDKLISFGNALNTKVSNPFYGQIPAGTGMASSTIAFGRLFQLNPLWLELWTAGGPYGNVEYPNVWGVGNYHSVYLQAEHRFGRGFSFLTSFTLSKLLQDTGGVDNSNPQGQGEQFQPQAGGDIGEVYGRAPSDIAKKFLVNYSFELPFGRGKKILGNATSVVNQLVGGWTLAGTTQFRSGQPISIFTPSGAVGGLGSQWYNIGQGRNNRPVMVAGKELGMTTEGHAALIGAPGGKYFMNPGAFRLTEGWELGNVPSTFGNWEGPGFSQWDLSLLKNVGLGTESRRLQLRMEAQNLLNHMNCGQPDGGVTRNTFGLINGQAGTPRRLMIAVKLLF